MPEPVEVVEVDDTSSEVVAEVDGVLVTHGELSDAFDTVADPRDWRADINAWVPASTVPIVVAAITFFTATEVTVTPEAKFFADDTADWTHVFSVGYRKGPAGP